jgi:predicted nucleic acid-binding protein
MILCDTNIVIHYFNDHPQTVDAWNAIGKANILLPVITILQLYRGMNNKIELAQMRRKFDTTILSTSMKPLHAKPLNCSKTSS